MELVIGEQNIENKQIILHITFSGTRYSLELIEPHNSEFIRLFIIV